ncbi:hypothetical protein BaRGS_00019775 [Batillaria attramentaria]|uniref:Uncharacterized protein n=1 Tax=Batillaria attramentaria TaxID=370345 RepID=A0ABD0KP92_9CAEN
MASVYDCNELAQLVYRQSTFDLLNAANTDSAGPPCSIFMAEEFQLDDCSRQTASCGKFVMRAFSTTSSTEKCE